MPSYTIQDISRNPATFKPVGGINADLADKLQAGKISEETLSAVSGFVPLGNRRAGTTKLVIFHIANALTLGVVGQFGAFCANSQVMGSQKNCAPLRERCLKDFGQTYLNATLGRSGKDLQINETTGKVERSTSRAEKILQTMTKVWSEGLGCFTGGAVTLGLLPYAALKTKGRHHERLKKAFVQKFEKEFGRAPSVNVLKFKTSEELKKLSEEHERSLASARQEYAAIMKAKAAAANRGEIEQREANLSLDDIENGSENLKGQFASFIAKNFALENLYFKDWAENVMGDRVKKLAYPSDVQHNGQPRDASRQPVDELISDGPKSISAYDLTIAYCRFTKRSADFEINLSNRGFKSWKNLYDNHLKGFQDQWNEYVDTRERIKAELSTISQYSPNYPERLKELKALEDQLDRLRQLTPEQWAQAKNAINKWHDYRNKRTVLKAELEGRRPSSSGDLEKVEELKRVENTLKQMQTIRSEELQPVNPGNAKSKQFEMEIVESYRTVRNLLSGEMMRKFEKEVLGGK